MNIEIDNKEYPIINKINVEDIMLDFENKYVYVPILMTKKEFNSLKRKYEKADDYQNVELAWSELSEIEADTADLSPDDFDQEMLDCINLRCRNAMAYLSKFVRENMGDGEAKIIVEK